MTHYFKIAQTPLGALKLVATDKGLTAVLWEGEDPKRVRLGALTQSRDHPMLARAETQLAEYFSGARKTFDIELDPVGTEFQKKVWKALLAIPFGETRSYAQIAKAVGDSKATRAVGAANGKNPISIVTPCHRVIGTDGSLTGFAGGLEAKRFLLSHEGATHAARTGRRSIYAADARRREVDNPR